MFLLKNMTELLFSSALLLILPMMLWVLGGTQSLIAQCSDDSNALQKPNQGSLSFFCSPLSLSACEKEKNVFSSSLQAPAMKVAWLWSPGLHPAKLLSTQLIHPHLEKCSCSCILPSETQQHRPAKGLW